MNALASYGAAIGEIKLILLYIGAFIAAVCVIDWLVRTRRVNPFSGAARFFRARVDPLLQPIERTIVRAGGVPSSAPWWALVAYVVLAIFIITVLQFAGGILEQVMFAAADPRALPKLLLSWAFSILRLAIIVRVLSSWLPISPYSRWVRWSYVLTEWMLAPLRRVIPTIANIDITPLVAWFGLYLIQSALGIP
jgi:YggT family protein